jgi:hypothetical protein
LADKNTTLIYIVGRGHSGSTLLDLLLGNHSSITGLGELKWLSNKKRARVNFLTKQCTCGTHPLSECEFWKAVGDKLEATHRLSLATLDLDSEDDQTFISHNMAFLSSIKSVTGHNYLVDSSKDANRLERLKTLCTSLDVIPVYIVRNPYGVVYSHLRRGRDLELWAKKYAAYTDEIHQALLPYRFHLVEYEKLSEAPGETLDILMAYLGMQMEGQQLGGSTCSHHNIGGNRLRYQPTLNITPDNSWRRNLTLKQKLIIFWHTHPQRQAVLRLKKEAA